MSNSEEATIPRRAAVAANPGKTSLVRGLARPGLASPQLGALLTLASAMTLGIGLIVWSMQPDYVPLSEQTSRQDALGIVEVLRSSQIDYKIDPGSGLVLVPKNQLSEIQLSLAASGITESRAVGLELLNEEPSMGISHFTETARYQHALEIELSRTISSMRNVDSARVHLALPKQSVFVRDREQASASIMVKAKQGRSIEEEQVNAIVNLVASSIPFLETGQVTVVDQWGRLLSSGDSLEGGATKEHYKYARQLENLYAERIETLLTPILGKGRVRAIVTAEFDFSTNEQTRELFDPDPTQLRSEQIEDQKTVKAGAQGVPGALTNQPPESGVISDEPAEDTKTAETPINQSTSTVRNFELDKTITHSRQSPGQIIRLSAAVIIDDQEGIDADGNLEKKSLTDAEIQEYTRLAQEAIGYSEARGDSVIVFNRPFQPDEEIEPIEPLPVWQQNWLWNMVRQLLVGLSVLLLVLLILRPAVNRLNQTSVAALEDESTDEDGSSSSSTSVSGTNGETKTGMLESPPVVYGDILNMARAMATDDPKRVAMVVKDWVSDQ